MEEIRLTSALKIFTNPDDLLITVNKDENSNKYSFGICHGLSHNFKTIFSTDPIFDSNEDAKGLIKKILVMVQEIGNEQLGDLTKKPNVLCSERITRIMEKLKSSESVNTSKM